jgi:hypothetical protein
VTVSRPNRGVRSIAPRTLGVSSGAMLRAPAKIRKATAKTGLATL